VGFFFYKIFINKKVMSIYISEYVSYKEVVFSRTAHKRGINNVPNEKQLERIKKLCTKVFDPLRIWVGGPVKVNSVFRSKKLNAAIGGSKTSQHMANKGAAIDIDDIFGHKTNLEMFHYIKDNLEFDQLIAEFPNGKGNPAWLHISYNEGANRNKILIATKNSRKKTIYLLYKGNEHLVGKNPN
jgi:zinc D-Ala-D-Ala carboxypeptidase